jgi:hypothetical protein
MRVINLDQDFKPYGSLGELFVKKFTFPSGIEPHINVDGLDIKGIYEKQDVIITHRIKSMTDVFEILLTVDALRRNYENEIGGMNLFIPYFPFSRQDRECTKGDPFSLEVFSNIINLCEFDNVLTIDIHSEKSKKYVKRLKSLNPFNFNEWHDSPFDFLGICCSKNINCPNMYLSDTLFTDNITEGRDFSGWRKGWNQSKLVGTSGRSVSS